jgi:DNA-binding response OmpR family regulator
LIVPKAVKVGKFYHNVYYEILNLIKILLLLVDIVNRLCHRGKIMEKTITVLVIDDHIVIRTLLEDTLGHKGFRGLFATTGQEGLKFAKTQDIDIILLDWIMPGMDGIEVLTELKNDNNTKDIPVIMLTSRGSTRDIEHAIGKGAIDYILKPFKPYEVIEMIQKCLGESSHSSTGPKTGFFSKLFTKH